MNIQLALHSSKIADLSYEEVRERVRIILSSTFFLAGYKPPEKADGKLMTEKLSNDLIADFGGLTLDEVAICFEMGVKDQYGEFMGLNIRTFTKWLKAYRQSDQRYKAVTESTQQALPPPSEDYSLERLNEMALRYFESYKETGEFGDCGIQVYQHLQKCGVITHSKEFKLKVISDIDRVTSNKLSDDIRRAKIINHAQVVCLKRFFQDLVEMDEELSNLI